MHNILVLGNGPDINNIDFDKIKSSVRTFGVNRIWLKHLPTYYFFHDIDIYKEISNDIKLNLIKNSSTFTSDWLRPKLKNNTWISPYFRFNRRSFPDSVTTGLHILKNNILQQDISKYTFYFAGINLNWTDPSHFWKDKKYKTHKSLNRLNNDWYNSRFDKMFLNFKLLKSYGFNCISVTPDSRLNTIMPFRDISVLYK